MNIALHDLDLQSLALLELGRALRRDGYAFVTVTPETHRRVNERAVANGQAQARTLRDVFGWSRPFQPGVLPKRMLELLTASGQLVQDGELLRATVRFSTAENNLFVHSGYPTAQEDAVFFGPDTYRFCSLVQRWAAQGQGQIRYALDLCGGTGAGALALAGRARRIAVADINPNALKLAAINAALAGVSLELVESDLLRQVEGSPDLIIANPPYMHDNAKRVYRDGGGQHGEGLSLRIVREAMSRLARRGELILYTGTAIVDGVDTFREQVTTLLADHVVYSIYDFIYEELDPDVFGEELDGPSYAGVDRIAVVGLHVRKR